MYDNIKFNNENFKKALQEKKITKTELAGQIGISPDSFTNYKKGRPPKTEYLYAIARFFNKNMEWFLTENDNMPETGAILAREDPEQEDNQKIEDLTLEEMYRILEKLMSDENPHLRGWTIVQFREAFGKFCQKGAGVREEFGKYIADKKNIQ